MGLGISRTQFIEKVRRRLGAPLVKVELCDEQIKDHIDYARQKYIKWAIGNATQETYFTVLLQAGKTLYDLPAGVVDVISYDDRSARSGGINTLFTMDNYLFSNGFFGNMFQGGYDMISYHLVLDFMHTLNKYRPSKYNFKYHKSTNQLEINPAPSFDGKYYSVSLIDPYTGVASDQLVESPGWLLVRAYMIEGSTLPDYKPDWNDILKEYKTIVERRVLVQDDIDNKRILLKHTPYKDVNTAFHSEDFNQLNDITITVNGATLTQGTDWYVYAYNGSIISWQDLDTPYAYSVGDVVEVSYPVVMESNYYPSDWTDVTATSTESEQFTITQEQEDLGYVHVISEIWNSNVKVMLNGAVKILNTDYTIGIDYKTITFTGMSPVKDDVVIINYVTIKNKRPAYEVRSQSLSRQYTTRIQNISATATDVTNKYITLEANVSVADGIKVAVGGVEKLYGVDFTVTSNNRVSWNGYALDGSISNGTKMVVTYTTATYYEKEVEEPLYDNDWMLDYVTALSKISLGISRRKFQNFQSMGNQGISLDGDTLVQEGKEEKADLEERLRLEEAYEGYGIDFGMM